MYPYGGETSVNGQTAAVDAHFGMATTWDFYKNVFNRDGIDNQGTSPISIVHTVAPFSGYYYDNAFWDDYTFGMYYSDGTLYPRGRSLHRTSHGSQSQRIHLAHHPRHHRPRDDARRDRQYRRPH